MAATFIRVTSLINGALSVSGDNGKPAIIVYPNIDSQCIRYADISIHDVLGNTLLCTSLSSLITAGKVNVTRGVYLLTVADFTAYAQGSDMNRSDYDYNDDRIIDSAYASVNATHATTADSATTSGSATTASNLVAGSTTYTANKLITNYCGPITRIVTSDCPYYAALTEEVILADTTGVIGITLPTITGNSSKSYAIADATGNAATRNITITGTSSQLIDGELTKVISTDHGSCRLVADNYGWYSIGASTTIPPVVRQAVTQLSTLVNLKTVTNYEVSIGGTSAYSFVPLRVIVTCISAVGVIGDAIISIGTTSGGTNILPPTPLTTLTAVRQSLVIGMFGLFPSILENTSIWVAVTSVDSGTSGTAVVTIDGTSVAI